MPTTLKFYYMQIVGKSANENMEKFLFTKQYRNSARSIKATELSIYILWRLQIWSVILIWNID